MSTYTRPEIVNGTGFRRGAKFLDVTDGLWTLTVNIDGNIGVSVHTSEQSAFDALRINYDPEGTLNEKSNDEALTVMSEKWGMDITIDQLIAAVEL